jgi:hypothetical protein
MLDERNIESSWLFHFVWLDAADEVRTLGAQVIHLHSDGQFHKHIFLKRLLRKNWTFFITRCMAKIMTLCTAIFWIDFWTLLKVAYFMIKI